jgi:hypothetical protein
MHACLLAGEKNFQQGGHPGHDPGLGLSLLRLNINNTANPAEFDVCTEAEFDPPKGRFSALEHGRWEGVRL